MKPVRKIPLSEEDGSVFAPPASKVGHALRCNWLKRMYQNAHIQVSDDPISESLQEVTHMHH